MKFDDPNKVLGEAAKRGWRRVLVITALPLEMAEVREHTEHVASCEGRDSNVFELGHFRGSSSDWLVVVGESGAGNHASQAMVTNACIAFGPFELILFVGVAATRKPDDAPIGSVVISEHVYFPYVGKYKDGKFLSRPREFPIDRGLVRLTKKVVRDQKWHERLKPPYGGLNSTDDLYPQPFPPNAITAPIISVEAVSADPGSALEQQITDHFQDATALEMEGFGVVFAAEEEGTPCIVIRGVSDDRAGKDPKLDKMYQPIAAAHGAAFAYELVDYWGDNRPAPEHRTIVAPPTPASAPPTTSDDRSPSATVEKSNLQSDTSEKVTAVLSFSGHEADFPKEQQRIILEVVRSITGNPEIEIIGTATGSFHIFLSLSLADLKHLHGAEFRDALTAQAGVNLVDVTTETAFVRRNTAIKELAVASHAVLNWPKALPDGTQIERPELFRLLQSPNEDEGQTTAIIGDPGSGKTALLASLAAKLRASGIPFLAIKADTLDVDVKSEHDLQKGLGLSELPRTILTRLALTGPVYLIIDQLDALAGYVDLRTGRLSVLLNLVRALGNVPNVRVIISARRFEYEHDTRLKSVKAESVHLELPPWSAVLQILEANGIKAAGWPNDAQQVMRSPQSLATLLRLNEASKSEPFDQYQKMLERLWHERILSQPNGDRVSQLAGRIAEDMATKETLWLARSRYDADNEDVKTLVSEGILSVPAGMPGSIGFSHQTIFEFALARSFAQKEGRLSSYVRDRVTSLFVRPKLWAGLTYLRGVELVTYETELRAIWSLPSLRLHLRHLLIEFLGQQVAPVRAEIEIMQAAMTSRDRRAALQSISRSQGWFAHFRNTEIAKAMDSETEAGIAAVILSFASEFSSKEVTDLIEHHWLNDSSFDGFTWRVLQDTPNWTETHLAIASEIVGRTDIQPFAFEHMISTVGAERPELAIRLVRARLDVMLKKALAEAEARKQAQQKQDVDDPTGLAGYMSSPKEAIERLVERSEGWDTLPALAKSKPSVFLQDIWPWFHSALEAIKSYREDEGTALSYPIHYSLDFRFEEEGTLGLAEPSLLAGLRAATEAFAAEAPEQFLAWFKTVEQENATPAQRLLAHTLSTSPARYATTALEFLLADGRRLNLGNLEDYSETTKRLISAVSPFWTDEQIQRFVSALISFNPTPEEDRDAKSRQYFYGYVERIRYELASCLPKERLGTAADSLVKQGERKFGDAKRGAVFSGPSWVGPSMSADEMGHAADKDVLNAFQELPDATGWDNPKRWMKGGNVPLSRAFADFAKANSDRAVEIIKKFTPDVGARAAGYAIDAMAETVEASVVLPLIQELESRSFATDEYRDSVARAIEKLVNRDVEIDNETLSMLERWLEPERPIQKLDDEREANSADLDENEDKEGQSILFGLGGLVVLPSGNFPTLYTITRIYLQRHDYAGLLRVLNEHLRRSEDERVWKALFRLFQYIRSEDTRALDAFYRALFAKYPNLSNSHEALILFAQLHWRLPDLVRDVLFSWQSSENRFVQQAYGELGALIALVRPELSWSANLIEDVLKTDSSSPVRTGAAYAAIHVWAEAPEKINAAPFIAQLAHGASERTWSAIIDIFRLVDEISPSSDWLLILQAIAKEIPNQPMFMSHFVIERLQTLLPHEAGIVASIAKSLVNRWGSELGDLRTAHAGVAPELVDIAVTLHRLGDETREAGLEIFEELLSINAYSARETLDAVDNRFRSQASQRARLPRRVKAGQSRRRRASKSQAH